MKVVRGMFWATVGALAVAAVIAGAVLVVSICLVLLAMAFSWESPARDFAAVGLIVFVAWIAMFLGYMNNPEND